jgi:uncharacterized protein involved in outer membrane biogenesis
VKLFSFKWRVAGVAAVILLLLFFLRPGASRLKSRIASSISSGVGRPVDIGSVHLRLLPRPGFDLKNLVVYDDPAFGVEPMLRANEVTAILRLTSLLRGRLEIARLDLTEPSLNLVRGANGRWNLEALLERTARTPLAPTSKAKSEPRPGFPYIEATGARINFKSGPEKKPYALTNADFSLWQDSENAWGVRLKAQPFRTDLNLNDTGMLQVNGTWQRAVALRDTPLQFSLEWNRAQLGQLTKLFTGNDQGWRGGVQLDVTLSGTPANLQISTNASILDFRRYDIASGQPLRLAGHCDGQYSSVSHAFHEVICNAPVGTGLITLKGGMGFPGSGNHGLVLTAERVPASAMVAVASRAKKNLPEDLAAGGTAHGTFSIKRDAATAQLRVEGRGEIFDFRLSSAANKAEIGPETVPFVLTSVNLSARAAPRRAVHRSVPGMRVPDGPRLEFGPFPAGIERAIAPTVRGWVSRAGYNISVTGESEIGKALRVTRMFGIPALQATAEGTAQVDLQIGGGWAGRGNWAASGFPAAQLTGTARLRNVRIALRGAAGPVEISSADLQLLRDEVRVEKLSAKAAGASWTGSLEMPRGCGTPAACQAHFHLRADQIGLSELSEWASPRPKERPWYRVLESIPPAGTPFLESVRASGRLSADRVLARAFSATRVSANVSLDSGKLQVSELTADFLGGKHRGEWQADFSGKPAVCSSSGFLAGILLTRLGDTMNDQWIAGTANASYEVKGACTGDFWTSAEGTLQFDVRDASLPHISLAEEAGGLKFTRFSGTARLHADSLEIEDARLDSTDAKFLVNGTASLNRDLDLKLARSPNGTGGYTITGTLADPRVVQVSNPETQAQLKTEPAK